MNEGRLKGMIGFAFRARQAVAGTEACEIMIRKGRCGVLLLDGGAGDNTRQKAEAMCLRAGVPLVMLPAGFIGETTGRRWMMIALQKGSFSEQILKEEKF